MSLSVILSYKTMDLVTWVDPTITYTGTLHTLMVVVFQQKGFRHRGRRSFYVLTIVTLRYGRRRKVPSRVSESVFLV